MQTCLIKVIQKGDREVLEVCTEGLIILRKLRHRKLRIVFNITHESSSQANLDLFNSYFLNKSILNNQQIDNGTQQQHNGQQMKVKDDNELCKLTIFKFYEDLSDERTVLILNAYEDAKKPPLVSIIGYLAASTFMYHQKGELNANGALTAMLSQFNIILKNTNIISLDEEIKYKSGFVKKPYFVCLLPHCLDDNPTNFFRTIYTYIEGNQQLNQAVDTLLDYFPERSAVIVNSPNQIQQIANQFINQLLGRQLFNFQITGSAMENLCFQMSEALSNHQKIDLCSIYTKVIENQRYRVEGISLQSYNTALVSLSKQLPLSTEQLLEKHSIEADRVIRQMMSNAMNCMQFNQFVGVYQNIKKTMFERYNQLINQNYEKANEVNISTYELLQQLGQLQVCDSGDIERIFSLHLNKLQLMSESGIGNEKNIYLIRLVQKHGGQMIEVIVNYLYELQMNLNKSKLRIEQLKHENLILKEENKVLISELEDEKTLVNECKLKMQVGVESDKMDRPKSIKQVQQLKKRIQDLEEQLYNKNIQIDQLYGILQNFDTLLEKGKCKYKLAKQINDSVKQVNDLVSSFDNIFDQIRNLHDREKQFKERFKDEKQKVIQQANQSKTHSAKIQAEFNQIIKDKKKLQQIIDEAKQVMRIMKEVEEQYKGTVRQLETRCGKLHCLLAETQGQLEIHQKTVDLLVQYINKGGKSQNLYKFIKVLKNQSLRQTLKAIIKK